MKISTNSRYAIRFLVQVALEQGRVTTLAAAKKEQVSEKMLERIAAKLRREGFVISAKGAGGGYLLARSADEITITQVLTVMETPYLPLHCVDAFADCCNFGDCVLLEVWQRVDAAIRAVTDTVTIADLARSSQQTGAVGEERYKNIVALDAAFDQHLTDAIHEEIEEAPFNTNHQTKYVSI